MGAGAEAAGDVEAEAMANTLHHHHIDEGINGKIAVCKEGYVCEYAVNAACLCAYIYELTYVLSIHVHTGAQLSPTSASWAVLGAESHLYVSEVGGVSLTCLPVWLCGYVVMQSAISD